MREVKFTIPEGRVSRLLARLAADQRGLTTLEYGLLGGLFVLAALAALEGLGGEVEQNFDTGAQAVADSRLPAASSSGGDDPADEDPTEPPPAAADVPPEEESTADPYEPPPAAASMRPPA